MPVAKRETYRNYNLPEDKKYNKAVKKQMKEKGLHKSNPHKGLIWGTIIGLIIAAFYWASQYM